MESKKKTFHLEDVEINIKLKLSALWIAVMFIYVYADIKALYLPGILEGIIAGEVEGFEITQVFLLSSAILMTIPGIMIFLSLVLKANINRWANIILGIIFTLITIVTLFTPFENGIWAHALLFQLVEIILTSLVVWYAWRWPGHEDYF